MQVPPSGPDLLAREVSAILAAARAVPEPEDLADELAAAERAAARGYFLPDEDAAVRLRYFQYLSMRSALLVTLEELAEAAGEGSTHWRGKLPVFVAAFAAACVLMRASGYVVRLAKDRPVVWKKLDEADLPAGIPRKTFTALYKSVSSARTQKRFIGAADFYFAHRDGIRALARDPVVGPAVVLLEQEELLIERRRSEAMKRFLSYRWFSFLRRHRSAWRQVMYGLFKVSGSAIAELNQPGVKPPGAGKRITPELREALLGKVMPGDVFVTRHDDAVSNLFLPGFWPHAALYLGTFRELQALGITPAIPDDGTRWFLEAKKDGVRFRNCDETLHVDACVLLRSPLEAAELSTAIRRAMSHEGKPFDFLFDYRFQDVVACTEVIYRGFHGVGSLSFHLEEVGGRLCLPAEELLNQAMDAGFKVVATAGVGGAKILAGLKAELAFHGSRQPL